MENVTLSVNEQNLIDNSKFKKGSRVTKIKTLDAKYQGHNAKTFESAISLSREILLGSIWFKTVEAKDLMKSKEVKWTNPEFGLNVYGYKKTQYCQYINVGKVTDEEIAAYKADAGDKDLSITALLAFLKPKTEEAETEEAETEETEETETESADATTFTFRQGDLVLNYSRDAEGVLHTTNEAEDLIKALKAEIKKLEAK